MKEGGCAFNSHGESLLTSVAAHKLLYTVCRQIAHVLALQRGLVGDGLGQVTLARDQCIGALADEPELVYVETGRPRQLGIDQPKSASMSFSFWLEHLYRCSSTRDQRRSDSPAASCEGLQEGLLSGLTQDKRVLRARGRAAAS